MENRTASAPPQPGNGAGPAGSDLPGKPWGAPGSAFPHPTAASAPKPARNVVKDLSGMEWESCPHAMAVLGVQVVSFSAPGAPRSPLHAQGGTGTGLSSLAGHPTWSHVIHFVSISCAGPKGHQNPPLHPNEFVGHAGAGLGRRSSHQLTLSDGEGSRAE